MHEEADQVTRIFWENDPIGVGSYPPLFIEAWKL